MPSGSKAKSAFAGDKPYQLLARVALPILVRQAKAGRTLTYRALADEIGVTNERTLNFVLGAVAYALQDLESEWGAHIPRLSMLVVNKGTLLPGKGVAEFFDDPESYLRATRQRRAAMVDILLQDIYAFRRWDEVLDRWSLNPATSPLPPQGPFWSAVPESPAHKELKEYVGNHPNVIGLPSRAGPGMIEACLPSGDEIDVFFKWRGREIAVEVKTADAASVEIQRGLYQCVKYEALLLARQRVQQHALDAEAVLVLGTTLPNSLVSVRNVLGVRVIENVVPRAPVRTASA
jgi:hypothetical protein